MKSLCLALLVLTLSWSAIAADYYMNVRWSDSTQWSSVDQMAYEIEWRVNGGTASAQTLTTGVGLPVSRSFGVLVTANAGDTIEVRVKTKNLANGDESPWSNWESSVAPVSFVTPEEPTAVAMQVSSPQ